MSIQHEVTRDVLLAFMQQHKVVNVAQVNDLYKSIYNVVQASTDVGKSLYGFRDDDKQG